MKESEKYRNIKYTSNMMKSLHALLSYRIKTLKGPLKYTKYTSDMMSEAIVEA